jgi:hypothetical protein
MSELRLPMAGLDFFPEQTVTQFAIPAGAGATFAAANNIGTITFNAAHGLTLQPAANVPPNYFLTFGGAITVTGGTGTLIGNIFRILSIPSATSITIYTTITAATITSLTGIPVFYPWLLPAQQSGFLNGPTQTIAGTVTPFPPPYMQGAMCNFAQGPNCAVRYNPDRTAVILDGASTPALGGTPAAAPVWRDLGAASTNNQIWICAPQIAIWANGTAGSSFFSQIQ